MRDRNLPFWASTVITKLLPEEVKAGAIQDFEQTYQRISETSGRVRAYLWIMLQVIQMMPSAFVYKLFWGSTMFKNYLILAFRNIKKHKLVSIVNISGLSFAIAFGILTSLFIQNEFSYNSDFEDSERIYSVIERDDYFDYYYRVTPIAVGPSYKEHFEDIEDFIRITSNMNGIVKVNNEAFTEKISFSEKNFFEFLSFNLQNGEKSSVLDSENSIVLTNKIAKKYFKAENPIGKQFEVSIGEKSKIFIVSGVTETLESSSTISFDIITNMRNYAYFNSEEALNSWTWPRAYLYIKVKAGVDPKNISDRSDSFVDTYMSKIKADRIAGNAWSTEKNSVSYSLQKIEDIFLKSQHISGNEFSSVNSSIILANISLLLIIIACINFSNLSIGSSSSRSIEIGLRKVLGAKKKSIIYQFWSESFLLIIFSLIIGIIVSILLLTPFNEISGKNLLIKNIFNINNFALVIGIAFLVSLTAGSYPGLYLSKFEPTTIFSGKFSFGRKNYITMLLIVLQFAVSEYFIISSMVMNDQINFINTKDLGYNKEGIVVINLYERDFRRSESTVDKFTEKATQFSDIKEIAGCIFSLGTFEGEGMYQINDIKKRFQFSRVHYNYVNTMGMELVMGRDFSEDIASDIDAAVVNEAFIKAYNIEDPLNLLINGRTKIIGVVKDYNYKTLKYATPPVIHFLESEIGLRSLLVRLNTSDVTGSISNLKNIYNEVTPNKPFNYTFLDDNLKSKYADENRWNAITQYASMIAIFITCIGLIGMNSILISKKIKEIGIRKVLGASIPSIIKVLSKDQLLLVVVSNILVAPLAYYSMNLYLSGYHFRTELSPSLFFITLVLTFSIAFLTICIQVLKVARSNPIDSLRYE